LLLTVIGWWTLGNWSPREVARTVIEFASSSHERALERQVAGLLNGGIHSAQIVRGSEAHLAAALPSHRQESPRVWEMYLQPAESGSGSGVGRFVLDAPGVIAPPGPDLGPPVPPPKRSV
jgi:hypothetical protein